MNDKKYKFFLISFFVILALPLLAAPPWFHPAAWGKIIVFRIIISILVFLLIWRIFSKEISGRIIINAKKVLCRKNKVFWPFWLLIALWAVFLLATIFSMDPYYSFWESPYRAGGFLNFSLYIIFAILAFLIIKQKDWRKIWDFSLIIGVLASIMAMLQYFQIFSKYLIPYEGSPPATFGNSMFLAIYLLLLIFFALRFGLEEKKRLKKIIYFLVILLFIFVILITKTRAVYLGLIIGAVYFFLFYPIKQKKLLLLKIATIFAIFLVVCSIYFVNTQDQLPEFIENNRILKGITSRFSLKLIFEETRFPAWQVALSGIKEKPILGWGPENFSIAFDKYYDPDLPGLSRIWWDRAHNFMFEIAVTAGIPALIIYLSLFGVLFWQLQKFKKKNPDNKLIYHGVQATFIAYLTASFFSFDGFSTYLISFLLIGYSLNLLKPKEFIAETPRTLASTELWKPGVVFGLFCILILFIYFSALKPLKINKEINWALHYSRNNQCEKAIEKMDDVLSSHSNIDSYARLQYIDIIKKCLDENMERKYVLAPKAVSALREITEIRPHYTRIWISLGNYLNILIGNKEVLKIENAEELINEANFCFEKASQLSPKREEIFLNWFQTDILSENYQSAKEKAEKCIDLNPKFTYSGYCWWKKGLANIYLVDFEQADKDMAMAIEKGHSDISARSLFQLIAAYRKVMDTAKDKDEELYNKTYKRMADVYFKLVLYIYYDDTQYNASLAYIYKEVGEYEKARKQSLKIVRLSPELLGDLKEFLKSILDLDNEHFRYRLYLAQAYYIAEDFEKAEEQGLFAWQLSTSSNGSRTEANRFLTGLYFHLAQLHYEKGEYEQAKEKALIAREYSLRNENIPKSIDEFLELLP